MATAVIEHLVEPSLESTTEFAFMAYFFCDFTDPRSLLPSVIIRSLIRQMLAIFHGSPTFENEIIRFIKEHHMTPSIDTWCELFFRVTKLLPTYSYFVLDGIDECSEDNQCQLLKFIEQLMNLNRREIKFFISSRPEVYIIRYIERAFTNTAEKVDLNAIKNRPEIEAFIDDALTERQKDGRLVATDSSILQETALMKGAKGM